MRLFPQDLGPRWYPRLIGRRAVTSGYGDFHNSSSMVLYSEPPPPRMGFWGRIWSRGAGVTDEEAATVLPSTTASTSVPFWILWIMGGAFSFVPVLAALKGGLPPEAGAATMAALLAGSGAVSTLWPRWSFRRIHQLPIKQAEVDVLLQHAVEPLQQQFLELVRDAVQMPVPAAEEERLRMAVRALAAAVESLPQLRRQALDTAGLRAEAAELHRQAVEEPDGVTAESLRRRARAVVQRADANEQSAVLARRTAALQGELEAQIAALREGLAVYQTPYGSTVHIQELAEAALQVASEAANVASARAELDGVLNLGQPAAAGSAEVTLTHG